MKKELGLHLDYTVRDHLNLYNEMILQHKADGDFKHLRETMKEAQNLLGLRQPGNQINIQNNLVNQQVNRKAQEDEPSVDLSRLDDHTLKMLLSNMKEKPSAADADFDDAEIID